MHKSKENMKKLQFSVVIKEPSLSEIIDKSTPNEKFMEITASWGYSKFCTEIYKDTPGGSSDKYFWLMTMCQKHNLEVPNWLRRRYNQAFD